MAPGDDERESQSRDRLWLVTSDKLQATSQPTSLILMKIYLGSDHRGFHLKEELKPWLIQQGHEVVDVGASSLVPDDDYVEYAKRVADSVSTEELQHRDGRGVLLCASGVGVDIVANRFKNIRCGLGISPEQIREAREDDDINVLALAADYIDIETAKETVKAFLETEFSRKERYVRRLKQLDE